MKKKLNIGKQLKCRRGKLILWTMECRVGRCIFILLPMMRFLGRLNCRWCSCGFLSCRLWGRLRRLGLKCLVEYSICLLPIANSYHQQKTILLSISARQSPTQKQPKPSHSATSTPKSSKARQCQQKFQEISTKYE